MLREKSLWLWRPHHMHTLPPTLRAAAPSAAGAALRFQWGFTSGGGGGAEVHVALSSDGQRDDGESATTQGTHTPRGFSMGPHDIPLSPCVQAPPLQTSQRSEFLKLNSPLNWVGLPVIYVND